MAKNKYYQIGAKASTFYDPASKLSVSTHSPGVLVGKPNPKVSTAIRNGVITEITESVYQDLLRKNELAVEAANAKSQEIANSMPKPSSKPEKEIKGDLKLMSKDELVDVLKNLPGMDDATLNSKKKLPKDQLIDFIEEWEEEDSDDDDDDDDDDDK